MDRRALRPAGVAVAGTLAVVIGIHAELLHVRPTASGTIETGWGGSLNHEETLLAALSLLGTVGALAASRWRRAALLPQAVGGVVLFYALRAVGIYLSDPLLEVYTGLPVLDGTTGRAVFGAEPYLLILGGLLLIAGGVLGFHGRPGAGETRPQTPSRSRDSLSGP
jgi:hypothetical protein